LAKAKAWLDVNPVFRLTLKTNHNSFDRKVV